MAVQPTGTVTLLFTDIEGSTKLLQELGQETYAEALDLHRRLLRKCFERHDGYEVGVEGDAFFVAFASAETALAAAAEGQEALAGADWPGGLQLRVRIGVHTGEPLLVGSNYVGMDVHRAARIMAAGHGGQVLISQTTYDLLDAPTPVISDLGEHRLKDLSGPQRLYQVGDAVFPALKTLYRTNLPVPATAFVGRAVEVAELAARVRSPTTRLLTLVGPGGTGKTRLALAAAGVAADAFVDGITWVPLASLREPSYLAEAVAQALEVKEEPGRGLIDSLCDAVAGRRRLLLFDNAEHLLPAIAADLARLRDADGPTLLVTSRERLRLEGEQTWPVPPLEEQDAVLLFDTRALAVDPSFASSPAVAKLCTRLDNLPLAVELAAARVALFSPAQLLDRLAQRLDLLTGARDSDPRHHTLRATIAWSYDLLNAREQRLFRRLSLFPGGCTFETAERVCEADPETLESLLDKSLVRRRETKLEPRYWMLETIREFAEEQLGAADESGPTRDLAIEWACDLAVAAEPGWRTPSAEAWGSRFALELDNLRQTMRWAFEAGSPEQALTITSQFGWLWQSFGLLREGLDWTERALAAAKTADVGTRGYALLVLGVLESERGNATRGLELCRDSLPLLAEGDNPHIYIYALMVIASIVGLDDPEQAETLLIESEAKARALGDLPFAGTQMLERAQFVARREPAEARSLTERAFNLIRTGNPNYLLNALFTLASQEAAEGEVDRARDHLAEARAIADENDWPREQTTADTLSALLELVHGQLPQAIKYRDRLREQVSRSEIFLHRMMLALIDAGIDSRNGRARQAVQGWASAEARRELAHEEWNPLAQLAVAQLLTPLRETLRPKEFAAAWDAGKQDTDLDSL